MQTLFCLLLLSVTGSYACVYSQSYWLSNASHPWPTNVYPLNQPLCGLSWHTLMHLNTSQVKDSRSTYWLLAFHQLCTAVLNLQTKQEASSSSPLPSSVTLSTRFIFDSMQRQCRNMSGWVQESQRDEIIAAHLSRIIQFNHAGQPCDPMSVLPFSFTQQPQLFFLGYNESEQSEAKRQAEVINHIYKVQTILVIFCSLAVLIIVLLGIRVIMLKNMRREYSCCRDTVEVGFYNASGIDEDDFEVVGQESDSPRFSKEKEH